MSYKGTFHSVTVPISSGHCLFAVLMLYLLAPASPFLSCRLCHIKLLVHTHVLFCSVLHIQEGPCILGALMFTGDVLGTSPLLHVIIMAPSLKALELLLFVFLCHHEFSTDGIKQNYVLVHACKQFNTVSLPIIHFYT